MLLKLTQMFKSYSDILSNCYLLISHQIQTTTLDGQLEWKFKYTHIQSPLLTVHGCHCTLRLVLFPLPLISWWHMHELFTSHSPASPWHCHKTLYSEINYISGQRLRERERERARLKSKMEPQGGDGKIKAMRGFGKLWSSATHSWP